MSVYINETGRRLAALRKEKGYTQKQVAEIIGVHEKNYNSYEVGRKKKSYRDGESTRNEKEPVDISNTHLCALADLYGVSVDYLLDRTEYRTINGEDIARITGLSDRAISILQWYGSGDSSMMYHIARDSSRLISWLLEDWEKQGGNSILQTLESYLQTDRDVTGRITPETGGTFDSLKAVQVDMNAVLLLQIVAACARYKDSVTG